MPKSNNSKWTSWFYSDFFVSTFLSLWATLIAISTIIMVYGYYVHVLPEQERFHAVIAEISTEFSDEIAGKIENPDFTDDFGDIHEIFWFYDENKKLIASQTSLMGFRSKFRQNQKKKTGIALPDKPRELGTAPFDAGFRGKSDNEFPGSRDRQKMGDMPPFFDGPRDGFLKPHKRLQEHELPPELMTEALNFLPKLVDKAFKDDTACSEDIHDFLLFAMPYISSTGKKYVYATMLPQPKVADRVFDLFSGIAQMLPFFIIGTGLLCFSMTRYFVAPMLIFSEVSREFASGKLSARVPDWILHRKKPIGEFAADFNNMAEKIEMMINGQRRMFGDISHELRSPLARLQVAVEILQRKLSDAEQPMVERFEKEISRLNALIGEILQFSKLENYDISRKNKLFNLTQSISHICSDASFEGKSSNKAVVFTASSDEIMINGVPALIERAVENLIRNSLKYTPENTDISVDLAVKNDSAVISVVDCGPGIPEDELKRVFTPFYCVAEEKNSQKGGIGLGLSIVEKTAALHHGSVVLDNRADGKSGLSAVFTLPMPKE